MQCPSDEPYGSRLGLIKIMKISPVAAVPTILSNCDAGTAAGFVALTPTLIRHCIDAVCNRANAEDDCWVFWRASESDLAKARLERAGEDTESKTDNAEGDTEEGQRTPPSLPNGILATASSNEAAAARPSPPALATFYLAYNTWDGRVLCVDCVSPGCGHSPSMTANSPTPTTLLLAPVLRRCLARIAVLLHCPELSWPQWGELPEVKDDDDDATIDPPGTLTNGNASTAAASAVVVPRPEHLKGWLTLH